MFYYGNPYGVSYLWNNIESLTGKDTTHIICKTMIRVPFNKPDIDKILNIKGECTANSVRENLNPTQLGGNTLVYLNYKSRKNENIKLKFWIPFRGLIISNRSGEICSQVLYINARKVGLKNIYIETVIVLTSSGPLPEKRDLQENKIEFKNKTFFRLNKNLPRVNKILGAQIKINLLNKHLKNNLLKLNGIKETSLMYIGDNTTGDKVILTKQIDKFSEDVKLEETEEILTPVVLVNDNLSTNLINSKNVEIVGSFSLDLLPKQLSKEKKNLKDFQEKVKDSLKKESKQESNNEIKVDSDKDLETIVNEEQNGTEEHKKEETVNKDIETKEEFKEEIKKEIKERKSSRPSKKSKLTRHMRKLNEQIGNNTKKTINFDNKNS